MIDWLKILHPLLLQAMHIVDKADTLFIKKASIPQNDPLIVVVNHSCMHDIPAICKIVGRHVYLLAGKEPRFTLPGFIFWLNGVEWIDRASKKNVPEPKRKLFTYCNKERVF